MTEQVSHSPPGYEVGRPSPELGTKPAPEHYALHGAGGDPKQRSPR